MRYCNRKVRCTMLLILVISLLVTGITLPTQAKTNTYYINSEEEFLTFTKGCKLDSYSKGKTYILTSDLDMSLYQNEFRGVPIFLGEFQGQNHTITGLDIQVSGSHQGLFRYVTEGAIVSDLSVKGRIHPKGSKSQIGGIAGQNSGSINHTLQELSSTENKVQDISRDHTMEVGIVTGCENRGTINGETNTGGITGIISIELTYDLDNTMGVSALITSSSKYLVYAVIDKCASYADISGKKECVGGIVGRMDYGAVKSGLAAGEIMCKTGDNTGGIAGLSAGKVENCDARVTLSGVNYVGGIVGDGQDVMNCYAYASLQRAEELYGAIAGISRGQVNNNYYVKNASKIGKVGAIDDISYEGKAQGLTYDEMAAREDVPDVFKTIEVTFMAHDEVIETRQVSFGEAVGELPKVTENDGDYWVWDSFDQEHIYYSMTIHGSYHKAITSLSTGEDVPKFLVEGSFNDTQHLQAIPVDSANADESYTLTVNDYEGTLKVRARGEQGGTLYVDNGSGIKEVKYQQDGSYHVFKMENGAIYQFVYGEESHIGIIIVILAAISLAGILGFVIIKKRRTL